MSWSCHGASKFSPTPTSICELFWPCATMPWHLAPKTQERWQRKRHPFLPRCIHDSYPGSAPCLALTVPRRAATLDRVMEPCIDWHDCRHLLTRQSFHHLHGLAPVAGFVAPDIYYRVRDGFWCNRFDTADFPSPPRLLALAAYIVYTYMEPWPQEPWPPPFPAK